MSSSSSSSSFLQSSAIIPILLLFLFTLPILLFCLPSFLPQPQLKISPSDELSDLALFHKTISSESNHSSTHLPSAKSHISSPNSNHKKIAFLFLTNTPLHFFPLWSRFFENVSVSHYNIYIHSDPSVTSTSVLRSNILLDSNILEKIVFVDSKRTQRSSPTLISAARRLLATSILHDKTNMFFALLSQTCIPLHSFGYLYAFLFDVRRMTKDFEFRSYIEIVDKDENLLDRYNARGEGVMVPEVGFKEFKVGSQFFVLSRRHSLVVIEDRRLWRKFRMPCLNVQSCYPEEHYFPTLLAMKDREGCSGYTLTRVNWTGMVDGHPHMYGREEVGNELVYKLRESNVSGVDYMFARKFAPECLGPLMEIADEVIFKD